jgi:hypothetical protein
VHSQLTPLIAKQHIADLRRAAEHHHLVRAATAAGTSDAVGRPVVADPATLVRRRVALMHPAAR